VLQGVVPGQVLFDWGAEQLSIELLLGATEPYERLCGVRRDVWRRRGGSDGNGIVRSSVCLARRQGGGEGWGRLGRGLYVASGEGGRR
jgi:hypothetical protein